MSRFASRKITTLDYKLLQTVEYIQQGWLSTCQRSATIAGLLTVTATLLLLFLKNSMNSESDSSRQNSHGSLIALELLSYASIFLNISSCMSCFVLLDRLGDIPYKLWRDPDVPMGDRTIMWRWLFCFITWAWSVLVQSLIYIWLQESKQIQIVLSVIGRFCILPFTAYILVPVFNTWKGRSEDADMELFSPRMSHRMPTLDQQSSIIPPASPMLSRTSSMSNDEMQEFKPLHMALSNITMLKALVPHIRNYP